MKQRRRYSSLRPRHVLLCMLAGLLLLAGIAVSQSGKMDEIAVQHETLAAQQDAMMLEEQRLQRMLEYAETDAYLEQYAREKFGYLDEDDYKFYIPEE